MTKKFRLPRVPSNLVLSCGRSQADLRGTSFGLRDLVEDRLLASAPGARAWATPFCRVLANTGGTRWFFFVAIIFPVQAYRRFVWVSVQASIFLVQLHRSERLGIFFLLVVQDPISRACHLSAPPILFNRMYSQLSLIPQRSRTY